jgi:hypothetical protein
MLRRFISSVVKHRKMLVVIALSFAFLWAIVPGYSLTWTGFGDYTNPNGEFVRGKTLWDWMELFLIPIFLGVGIFLLNRSEQNTEREISIDRQRENALQSYVDRMADLLLMKNLRTVENKEVSDIARIRTLSVLRGLDGNRKGILLRFIKEAFLIDKNKTIFELLGADLSGANLSGADLEGTDLSGANLNGADLIDATLISTNLIVTDLTGASLNYANLVDANLTHANLTHANLTRANLVDANLSFASLDFAKLDGTGYSTKTIWPDGFDPKAAGARLIEEKT